MTGSAADVAAAIRAHDAFLLTSHARPDGDAIGSQLAMALALDALGKRLTEVANLDRGEFDFDAAPAVGGPEDSAPAGEGPAIPAVDELLDSLGAAIDDRSRQLMALEAVILSRELARQIVPGGRPVESGYISSFFGTRPDPFTGESAFHAGIDFAAAPGTRVLAAADGVVSYAGRDKGYGKLVEVTHGNGYVTRYAHNAKLLVKPGQTVKRGEPIALMGSTGRSAELIACEPGGGPIPPLRVGVLAAHEGGLAAARARAVRRCRS